MRGEGRGGGGASSLCMAYYSTYSGKLFCFVYFPRGTSGEGEAWIPSQRMKRRKRTKQS